MFKIAMIEILIYLTQQQKQGHHARRRRRSQEGPYKVGEYDTESVSELYSMRMKDQKPYNT